MTQVKHWNKLSLPGITSIVGAGGKSTILRKIVEYGLFSNHSMMVSTTTKMLESQVEQWKPYIGTSFEKALEYLQNAIWRGNCGGWFSGIFEGKVHGVEPTQLDMISQLHPNWHIVVEADGAKAKWIKAPKVTEPVIPKNTSTTIGVINLQALGSLIDDEFVYNKNSLIKIVKSSEGDVLTPKMLARLVVDLHGLFQYSRGKKILFCTGYDSIENHIVDKFLDELTNYDIKQIFLADGYRESCQIRQVIQWKN